MCTCPGKQTPGVSWSGPLPQYGKPVSGGLPGHLSCWDWMSLKKMIAGGYLEQAYWTEELDVLVGGLHGEAPPAHTVIPLRGPGPHGFALSLPMPPPSPTSLSTTPSSHFLSSVLRAAAQEASLAAPCPSMCTDTGPRQPLGLSRALPGRVPSALPLRCDRVS